MVEPVGMITPLTIPTSGNVVEAGTDLSLPGLYIMPEKYLSYSEKNLPDQDTFSTSEPEKKQDQLKEWTHETKEVPGPTMSIVSMEQVTKNKSNLDFGEDSGIDKHRMADMKEGNKGEAVAIPRRASSSSSTTQTSCGSFSIPIDMTLFRDPVFLLVSLVFAIGTPTVYGTWTYLPSLAQQLGYIKEEGAYLVMMNNVASAVSPPICGFLTSLDFLRHHIPKLAVGIIVICAANEAAVFFFLVDFGKESWMVETVCFVCTQIVGFDRFE